MSDWESAAAPAAEETTTGRLVSCVMATIPERRSFLAQAVKYFLGQTQSDKELSVVGEEAGPSDSLIPNGAPIRYLQTRGGTNLGEKLNIGIEVARGSIIQKVDDDDYYHAEFLAVMASSLDSRKSSQAVAAIDCCPVLITQSGDLKWTGHGRFAGGTLCFPKSLWHRCPFRDVPKDVDRWFLEDQNPDRVRVCRPGLYIYVRHGGTHLWTHRGGQDVREYFSQRSNFWRPLGELMDPDDVGFYRRLREQKTL